MFVSFAWCQVAFYIAGFPCKAFSKLRHITAWLEDSEARQFYACVDAIKELEPIATRQ